MYQRYISPVKYTKCPYFPTCSAYAVEAVEMHGALKGTGMALWRILRCNPFSKGGYDPVPEKPGLYLRKNMKRKSCIDGLRFRKM